MILTWTTFDWSTRATDRRVGNSALCMYAVACWNVSYRTHRD